MSGQGPMTGKIFSGRYEIGERIGVGGMAEVYSATDTTLGRVVAVKVMLPQYASDPDFTRRFRQEAAAAANLQSPYIVNVYDWGHDQGTDTYFIVMEYVRGSDLKTAIQQRGAINERKVAEIGAQVCQALSVAHQQDIIHRDIKPQNIMVQPDGNVKVMDFGIARAKNSTSQKTETVLGTAHYTSPEQAQGKELTAASDIYSLGIVLYEAVTGTLPFDGPDAVSVALMQVRDFPPAPHEFKPDINPDFETIIMTALEKDPTNRFATANDMRVALNDFLAGRPLGMDPRLARDGFTSAETAVIAPIGNVAGDTTQVMPVVPSSAGGAHAGGHAYRGGDGSPDQPKSKKKAIIGVVVAIVAIAAIAIGCFFAFGGEKVDVPDLMGMTSEEAQVAIEEAGFQVGEINNVYDDEAEPGTVVGQNPSPNTQANKGSKINIDVSQGTEEVDVPDLYNLTLEEARKSIVDAGLSVGETSKDYSDDIEEGRVMKQTPEAKSKAPKGSKVDLVISQGSKNANVPDVEGLSEEAARAKIEREGFVMVIGERKYSDTVAADCVISQSPTSGSSLEKGGKITVVISRGEEPVVDNTGLVPNVVGSSESMAKRSIENAGFKVDIIRTPSSSIAKGTVIQQTPDGGEKRDKGSTITIEVSDGPSENA